MSGNEARPVSLVWIDARKALIVRWVDDAPGITHVVSDVPAHRKSSGHVRHDPRIRPGGGGGTAATCGEPRRIEHLARFLSEVADRLPEGDLELIGPGTVHEKLARIVSDGDPMQRRTITVRPSRPLTERQLVARVRHLAGSDAPRRHPTRRGAAPGDRQVLTTSRRSPGG